MSVAAVSNILAILTIIGQAGVVLVLLGWPWRKTLLKPVYEFLSMLSLPGSFLVVAGSIIGSLYFSLVAKYPACELCWYQRILMYPQLVLIGLAMVKRNRDIVPQGLILSGLGFLIAAYQTYLQYGGSTLVPCSTTSFAVSCSQQNFLLFGYITLPVMALTGFAMLLVAMLLHRETVSPGDS